MRIGEVSKMLGVNTSAIRFYERHGLLDSNNISRAKNGYRIYSQQDVDELRIIIKFKEFGLELREIKHLLSKESKSCGDLDAGLDEQLEKCRQMEALIQRRISALLKARNSCNTECTPGKRVRKCCASIA